MGSQMSLISIKVPIKGAGGIIGSHMMEMLLGIEFRIGVFSQYIIKNTNVDGGGK